MTNIINEVQELVEENEQLKHDYAGLQQEAERLRKQLSITKEALHALKANIELALDEADGDTGQRDSADEVSGSDQPDADFNY